MQVRGNAPGQHGHNPGEPAGGAAGELPSEGGYKPHRIPHHHLATLKWHRREESLTGYPHPARMRASQRPPSLITPRMKCVQGHVNTPEATVR